MENRHGLAVKLLCTQATGRAEPEAALAMIEELRAGSGDLGGRQRLRQKALVQEMREHGVTPHFARKQTSIIDQRTTRHPGTRSVSASANGGRDLRLGQDRRRAA